METAQAFGLPLIVSTSATKVYSGPVMTALRAVLRGRHDGQSRLAREQDGEGRARRTSSGEGRPSSDGAIGAARHVAE